MILDPSLVLGPALMFLTTDTPRREYHFDRTISREVLENYLARSITMMDLLSGKGDIEDNIRMLTHTGAKFAGRTLYVWGGESRVPGMLPRAREIAEQIHAADPEMILQAGIYEIVTTDVNRVPIPAWVFGAFDLPPEVRHFRYEAMLYPDSHRRDHWRSGASVPDMSQLETRLWFFYAAASYIDVGIEAIHFGQVEIMDNRDPEHQYWRDMLERVRAYAAQHARRHLVLCDAHVPSGGIVHDDRLMFDLHSFPLRIEEVADAPQQGVLKVGYLDSIFGRSKGGITPSGWSCEHLPYMVELDNFGSSGHEGENIGGHWCWGYDEICWFAHQPTEYRNAWLRYAWGWIRGHDPNGFLEMPGSRGLASPVDAKHWYFANRPGPALPGGFDQEEAIKVIWEEDAGGRTRANADRIQPYEANPRYWQYQKKPVLLLGGSQTDHIFLLDDLKEHLDEIADVGGNYVRNTMSQRESKALKPHKLLSTGKFDLDQWNEEYWARFQNMLRWTAERDIVVQIEVWDRFDYSQEHWLDSPWNPANNVNDTHEETGLAPRYPQPAWKDAHPFFHTIEGMARYQPRYERIRTYQEAFVEKMLSYSLPYGHVLYCMNNETSTHAAWGQYWIRFIQKKATEMGVTVATTDMFDDAWRGAQTTHVPILFDNRRDYTFADISQVNSRNFGEVHWDRMQWLIEQISQHPRPINNVKIYGDGNTSWGSGTPKDGVERFWRDLIGGCASMRHHRDGGGIGLQPVAKACIQAARKLDNLVRMWELTPHMEWLSEREENEAYLAAQPGEQYALYFTDGGSVGLDLRGVEGPFRLKWIEIGTGQWGSEETLPGDAIETIAAPGKGGWAALIVR